VNGFKPKSPTSIDTHFLRGYKWNTLLSYNVTARKFFKYKIAVKETPFVLPISAGNLYTFCFWAGKNIDEYKPQDVSSKTLAKYIYGLQAWHLYYSVEYPAESKVKIAVLLRASAHANSKGPPRPIKAPVTVSQLVALTNCLAPRDNQCKAVIDPEIVAFWGMARLAEVTYNVSSGPLQRTASLLTSDARILEGPNGIVVELKTCTPGEAQYGPHAVPCHGSQKANRQRLEGQHFFVRVRRRHQGKNTPH
jgi:hypothetical protein